MAGTIKLCFSLPEWLFLFYYTRAAAVGGTGRDLMRPVLGQWASANGSKDQPDSFELVAYRALTRDVAKAAENIREADGWHGDITLRAVRPARRTRPGWPAIAC